MKSMSKGAALILLILGIAAGYWGVSALAEKTWKHDFNQETNLNEHGAKDGEKK
jgi:hypothetical protein